MVGMGLSQDVSRSCIGMRRALNDGQFSIRVPCIRDNTTPTSIETFAGHFAQAYRRKEANRSSCPGVAAPAFLCDAGAGLC